MTLRSMTDQHKGLSLLNKMLNDEQQSVHKINKGNNIFKQHEPNSDEYHIITKCLLQPRYKNSGNTSLTQMSMDFFKILFCISKLAYIYIWDKCKKVV